MKTDPAGVDVVQEIAQFLYHEAYLLDTDQFDFPGDLSDWFIFNKTG